MFVTIQASIIGSEIGTNLVQMRNNDCYLDRVSVLQSKQRSIDVEVKLKTI